MLRYKIPVLLKNNEIEKEKGKKFRIFNFSLFLLGQAFFSWHKIKPYQSILASIFHYFDLQVYLYIYILCKNR